MLAPFSKALQCFSDLFHVCATQWPVWDLGAGLPHSRIVKALGSSLDPRMLSPKVSPVVNINNFMELLSWSPSLCDLPDTLWLSEAWLLDPSMLPCSSQDYVCISDQAVGGQRGKSSGKSSHVSGTTVPLFRMEESPPSEFWASVWRLLLLLCSQKILWECQFDDTVNSGLLPWVACYHLLFGILRQLLHVFCPWFLVAFSRTDGMECGHLVQNLETHTVFCLFACFCFVFF